MSQALVSIQKVTKSFGTRPLFSELTLVVAENDRLALIGPNGAGKSTLLRMIAGLEDPDEGEIARRRALRVGYLAQQPEFRPGITIGEVLREAADTGEGEAHERAARLERTAAELGLRDMSALAERLSGGWKKRLAIGAELVKKPDMLLLDEPTNHLDIDGILWLEEFLSSAPIGLCFVSHDRYFIERLAKRVIEIDRRYPRGSFSTDGNYSDFLWAREQYLEGLEQTQRNLANKVRREVEWLRQGAKARTTKSKHRSEQAHLLVEELNRFDLDERSASIEFSASNRKTRELVSMVQVSKAFGGRSLFKDVSLTLSPATRLGVVGPNGSGKTTFIKTLMGESAPDSGQIVRAPGLRIEFFDQERKQLNPNITLKRALCDEGDSLVVRGRQYHVVGWANKFLFRADQLSMPVSSLSGGEQARVLLSRLVRHEVDILVFDEPTNDLDISTLEILEESFVQFPGAIVLVTHDRYFMDRVATTVLGLGSEGPTSLYADYSQWEISRAGGSSEAGESEESAGSAAPAKSAYELQKELQSLERKIEKGEKRISTLRQKLHDPEIAHDHEKLGKHYAEISAEEENLARLMEEWERVGTALDRKG